MTLTLAGVMAALVLLGNKIVAVGAVCVAVGQVLYLVGSGIWWILEPDPVFSGTPGSAGSGPLGYLLGVAMKLMILVIVGCVLTVQILVKLLFDR
ncbi:MAG: hypothetical protein R3F61_24835 [Myxococcota bacterium]